MDQLYFNKNYPIITPNYTGVDISDKAINIARTWEDDKTKFQSDDLMTFTPDRIYDCIIFNESLYYFDNPLKLLSKYKPFLSKNGAMVISMWDYKVRNNKLWKSINSILDCTDGVHLKLDCGNSWYIRFYRKIISLYLLMESSIVDLYYSQWELVILI